MTTGAHSPTMRLAAVGIFVGLPLVALALVVLNLVRIGETRALTQQRTVELQPLQARLAREGGAADDRDVSGVWLVGASRALAAARLQQRVVEVVADADGRLVEVQDVDDEEGDDILLRATYDAGNGALLASLHALETGLPLIDIESLSVRAAAAAGGSGEGPRLRVDLVVRGYRTESGS